jgi:Flp pilus assembly protein TadD
MRVGAAARAGGDYANAVSVYRHAAEIEPRSPVPFIALGDTLADMGNANEAIVAYNPPRERAPQNPLAQRGIARAFLMTNRPELALEPINQALAAALNDPKLLMLAGVANDLLGQHSEAQDRYRQGLVQAPGDPSLTVDLALSLALIGDYPDAISALRPVALSPAAGAHERQTLAMIYGLKGDQTESARIARMDLDEAAVEHNLSSYEKLRHLSMDARNRAILSTRGNPTGYGSS